MTTKTNDLTEPIDMTFIVTAMVTEKNVGGNDYIVKSVFVGDKDVKDSLLELAERKEIREMGLDSIAP